MWGTGEFGDRPAGEVRAQILTPDLWRALAAPTGTGLSVARLRELGFDKETAMGEVFGYELVAQALKNEGADTMFFIMGGPMLGAQDTCRKLGIRMIDVRHEQAAAMMANAYARLTGKAGLCSTASGPAATNLLTGLAHALTDAAPIIALGGASPIHHFHTEAFQEADQLSMMRPASKWAGQAINPKRIPDYINTAYRHAMTGRRGPAYLDLPGMFCIAG